MHHRRLCWARSAVPMAENKAASAKLSLCNCLCDQKEKELAQVNVKFHELLSASHHQHIAGCKNHIWVSPLPLSVNYLLFLLVLVIWKKTTKAKSALQILFQHAEVSPEFCFWLQAPLSPGHSGF